jgi:mono/diheme cytochrome c family protein
MQAMQIDRRWTVLVIAVVAMATLVMGGCAGASAPEVPDSADGPEAELSQGRDVWVAQCARCHGGDGSGGAGPNVRGPWPADRQPDADTMATIIAHGRGAMPGFASSLSDEEIQAVTRYVREVL